MVRPLGARSGILGGVSVDELPGLERRPHAGCFPARSSKGAASAYLRESAMSEPELPQNQRRWLYNCHVHVFTSQAAPGRFLPFFLLPVARSRVTGPALGWLLRNLWPFSKADRLERLAAFATIGRLRDQRAVLEHLRGFYSQEFRFVILTLDMDYMGAGRPPQTYVEQLQEVMTLSSDPELRECVLPFVCADPRRADLLEFVKHSIDRGCRGVKIYPPLGFWPTDSRLQPLYDWAEADEIPILAHCSRGGAHFKGRIHGAMRRHPLNGQRLPPRRKRLFGAYADPDLWGAVLARNPSLRLCLAHYGGGDEWDSYLHHARPVSSNESWIRKINDLIKDSRWPHVYADVSATAVDTRRLPMISVLANRPETRDHVLFGSDFFMIQRSTTERQFGLQLRAMVGENAWNRMAGDNVRRWLGRMAY